MSSHAMASRPMSTGVTAREMPRILVVRLGAMGDIIHTLPAVAAMRITWPDAEIAWLVEPRWRVLLGGVPGLDKIEMDRRATGSVWRALREIRGRRFDWAVDFQGLLKSAIPAWIGVRRVLGFHSSLLREKVAAVFYAERVRSSSRHVVDMNLDLARAAGARAAEAAFPLPPGRPEGALPDGPFVLASPFAGWGSKQWPLERYSELAAMLRASGRTLVVNGAPAAEPVLRGIRGAWVHVSGIEGLIDATRRAEAVAGVDSGPMHLAAALGVRGVAIFGPTDPSRNGPYGKSFRVLRSVKASTSYKRQSSVDASMLEIDAAAVFEALNER